MAMLLATGAASPAAWGITATWIGTNNSWGFIGATNADAVWTGNGGGVNVPPNSTSYEVFIGNNGSVNLGGGSWAVGYIHLGQSGPNFPGTGQLTIDSGTIVFNKDLSIGDGSAGTLNIAGGQLDISTNSNHVYMGGGTISQSAGAQATVNISDGTLLLAKYGLDKWANNPALTTVNMTGGVVTFPGSDSLNTINADTFSFTGGTINGISKTTITALSGNGVINVRNNTNSSVVINTSVDSSFDGQIKSPGSTGSNAHGTISFVGTGVVTLGPDAQLYVRDGFVFNGGTVKLGRNEQLADGANPGDGTFTIGAAGILDLNGFAQTCKILTGSGFVNLGGGSLLTNITSATPVQFDGVVSGSGTFSKGGTGALVLTANQTASGTTSINNGSLILQTSGTNDLSNFASITLGGNGNLNVTGVSGGFALSAGQTISNNGHVYGNVNVPVGSTLKGSGTFVNSVSVSGTIANNGSVGSMTVGALSLNSASLNFELSSDGADKIVVSNPDAFTLSGTSTVTLKDLGGLGAGTYTLISYNGTPLSDLGQLTLSSPTLSGFNVSLLYNSLSATSIDLSVTAVASSASTWNFNGDGNVSESTKWDGGTPNGVDAVANLNTHSGSITAPNVTVTLDQPTTLGTLNFDHPTSSYTVAGTGSIGLTLDVSSGQAGINVISGNHIISAPIVLNKDTTITVTPSTSTLAVTGNLSATGATITKAGLGTVQFENVRATSLSVTAGSVAIRQKTGAPNSAAGTSIVNSLSITSGASVDLTNNALILQYASLGTLLSDTRQQLLDGRLKTSLSSGGHALGYADNAVLGRGSFGGQPVGANNVLIGYTVAGDANLDGRVNALDFNAIASNFGGSGKVWTQGDLTYDGLVNSSDFLLLSQTFGQNLGAAPGLAMGTVVPEPVMAGLIPIVLLSAGRRRRR